MTDLTPLGPAAVARTSPAPLSRRQLCHVFSDFALGGVEVRTAAEVNTSADRYRHTIVSLSGDTSCAVKLDPAGDTGVLVGAGRPGSPGRVPALARQLGRIAPDLVITHGWGGTDALLAARLAGLRVVHAQHGMPDEELEGEKATRRLARRALFRLVRNLVVPSQHLQALAVESWRVPETRIRLIRNGVDTVQFRPPTPAERQGARAALGVRDGQLAIGTVGGLRPVKNHERLLRLAADLAPTTDAVVLVAGEGQRRAGLQATAAALGLTDRVRFLGGLADVAPFLHALDVFVLTSNSEQMPNAVLEAMSTGLAVVSTDVGEVRTMVSEPNRRYVVPAGAPLQSALHDLVAQPQERTRVGAANRAACLAHHGVDDMRRRYDELYAEALA